MKSQQGKYSTHVLIRRPLRAAVASALVLTAMSTPALAEELSDGQEAGKSEPIVTVAEPAANPIAEPVVENTVYEAPATSDVVALDAPVVDTVEPSATEEVVTETPAEEQTTDSADAGETAETVEDAPAEATDEPVAEDAVEGEAAEGVSADQGQAVASEAEPSTVEADAAAAKAADDANEGASLEEAASKRPVADGTYVLQTGIANNMVLDAAGANPKAGANVSMWTYSGGKNQKWEVVFDEIENLYRLFVSGTSRKLALGVTKSGTKYNVCVLDATSKKTTLKSILWSFVDTGSGSYYLRNALYTDRRADIAGGKAVRGSNVCLWTPNAAGKDANQSFTFVNTAPRVKAGSANVEGSYNLKLSSNKNVNADISGGSKANGGNAILWSSGDGMNQRFYLERDKSGFYTVWSVNSGLVLDVAASSILPGANVIQWKSTGGDNQKWAVVVTKTEKDGTKVVTLQNKATGLFLGSSSKAQKGNLMGVTGANPKQFFTFVLAQRDLVDEGIVEIHPYANNKVSLDIAGALADNSKTGAVKIWTDNNTMNQRFELISTGDANEFRIRTASSGGWLTYNGGSSVVQAGKGADRVTNNTTWRVVYSAGKLKLYNVGAGKYLDTKNNKTVSATDVILANSSTKSSQYFVFESSTLLAGQYVALQRPSGKFLQVTPSSGALGMNTETLSKHQEFFFTKSGDKWRISDHDDKFLTAKGKGENSAVAMTKSTTGNTQLWEIGIADGGAISIVSVYANRELGVKGTRVILGESDDGIASKGWKIISHKVSNIRERIAQVAEKIAADNSHGYSQPNRAGDGTTSTYKLSDGTTVKVHGGDYDCSELVRVCINAALTDTGTGPIKHLDTRCEESVLMDDELFKHGYFVKIAFSRNSVQRGDILWVSGHTAIATGNQTQTDANLDEYKGIYGPNKGDQRNGEEITKRALTDKWTYIYRYYEGKRK